MRKLAASLVLMASLTACADRTPPPEPVLVNQVPPRALVRIVARPKPAAAPALPAGPTIPRDVVLRRERVAGEQLNNMDATIANYEANVRGLMLFFGFKDPATAPESPAPAPPAGPPAALR